MVKLKRFYLGLYYGLIVTITGVFIIIMAYIVLSEPNIYVSIFLFALLYTLMIIIGSYLPLISAKAGRLKIVNEGKLIGLINKVFNTSNIDIQHRLKLYYRPALKRPVANATVQGYSNFTLILNEDLVKSLSEEELEAVLYHEIYHIKRKHDLIRTIVTIAVGIAPMILYVIINMISINIGNSALMSILYITMFVFAALYVLFMYRKQEFKADLYAARKCNNEQVVICALAKITKINNESTKLPFIREILSTHPSLNKRIDVLEDSNYNKITSV